MSEMSNPIADAYKCATKRILEWKEKKMLDSLYIKCAICGKFKPFLDAVQLDGEPEIKSLTPVDSGVTFIVSTRYEIVCKDCASKIPIKPVAVDEDEEASR